MADKSIKSRKVVISVIHTRDLSLLERTLEALEKQTCDDILIKVTDISSKGAGKEGSTMEGRFQRTEFLEPLPMAGMARAHNRVFDLAGSGREVEYAVILEAGVLPEPRFVESALAAFGMSPRIGQVSCLLTALTADGNGEVPAVVVSGGTGISTDRRTYDLFEGMKANGVPAKVAMVFGAHQACAAYRISMLREVAAGEGEVFDEDFIGPKAGVDLSWRSQIMGWNAVHIPACRAFLAPETDLAAPFDLVSYRKLSYRNRYLMILKNDFLGNLVSRFHRILPSEAEINFYSLLFEPSLLFGLPFQVGLVKSTIAKRAETMKRRRRGRVEMEKILAFIN